MTRDRTGRLAVDQVDRRIRTLVPNWFDTDAAAFTVHDEVDRVERLTVARRHRTRRNDASPTWHPH